MPYLDEKGNETGKVKVRLPSIEGLACYIDCARSSIYLWKEQKDDLGKEFSDILEQILEQQAARILSNGMGGQYNSTIAKLVLGKHGYVDEKHNDLTTGGKPIPPSILGDQIK